MPIAPERYADTGVHELLSAAARGHLAFDRRLIRALLDRGDALLPELLRFTAEDRSGDRVDISVDLIRLIAARPSAEAVPYLMGEIRRFPEDVPDEMAEALARIGEPAVGPLIETAEPVEDIGFLLSVLGVRDDRIKVFITDLLDKDPPEGAFLAGLYGDPALAPALEAAREQAPEAVEKALESLEDDPPRDLEPFDIEAEYPEELPPDVGDLPEEEQAEFLASESAALRAAAVTAWTNRELDPKQADRLFDIARNDAEEQVRGLAWEALRLDADQDRIRQAMTARIEDPATGIWERAGLAIGLSAVAEPAFLMPHAQMVYEDEAARAKALEAMWRTESRIFEPYITRHLDDEDGEIREEAIYGVGFLGLRGQLRKIEALFEHEDFRTDALFSWILAAPGEENRAGMKQLRKRVDELSGGLSEQDEEVVEAALQIRAHRAGKDKDAPEVQPQAAAPKVGRNEPCPCGSGRKYKKCCGAN
ncbi:MAG: SEC-C metal-binding domain-containing protein [Bryobacteraceae bacterium]